MKFIIYSFPVLFILSCINSDVEEQMTQHFETHKATLLELKDLMNTNIDSSAYIDIEFSRNNVKHLILTRDNKSYQYRSIYNNPDSIKFILNLIDWTEEDLNAIKKKLNEANCISASSGNPVYIGWKRKGMNMYLYNIYNQDLTKSQIEEYDNHCDYKFYKHNVVFQCGQGIFGGSCFCD